ncbi:MAG: hypothetical protein EAX96_15725 [Candidatus Lokiarchaeota archaeon]|nr:hypothetical protein [Candidatus Lokiarchaeota archaeon]
MKTIEFSVLNSEIRNIIETMFLQLDDEADIIDIIAAGDRKFSEILGNKPFPIDIFQNLMHLLFNPETEEFYEDIGVEARDSKGKWLSIRRNPSINVPDKSFIYLTPDAGC